MPAQVISPTRDRVGESPVWSVAQQALYWVDIEGRLVHRLDWQTKQQSSWALDERVGCIALSVNRTVIAAMETGVFELVLAPGAKAQSRRLASITHPQADMRFNDGRCDAHGRFWISTMCRDMSLAQPAGGVYCLDERGLTGPVVQGLITPNGMAFSTDGQRAYLSDSHPSVQQIHTHDFEVTTGHWGPGRLWVDMKTLPGRPDGAAVDTENCYWICGNDAGVVHRFSPRGELLLSLPVPVSKPAMCAFGGPALDQLLVTSIQPAQAAPGFDPSLDGAVFVLQAPVRGLPEPEFSRFPRFSATVHST